MNKRELPKSVSADTPPLEVEAWLTLKTSPFPICVTTSNLVILSQRMYA